MSEATFELLSRQARILHGRLARLNALVAGAGMVGSWTALALVKALGGEVHVWDDDTVEAGNVGVQAYDGKQIGLTKVDALAGLATDPPIIPHFGRFPEEMRWEQGEDGSPFYQMEGFAPHTSTDTVVICAVDSMKGRREIGEWAAAHEIGLFIETGVHAELVQVKTCAGPEDYEWYLSTLMGDDDVEEAQCGLKGTAYAGMSLASQVVPLVNAWAAERRLPRLRQFHTGLHMLIGGDETAREEVQQES